MKLIFIIALTLVVSITVQAQYTLQDDDVIVEDGVITEYTNTTETDIIIPNMLDGQVINAIGDNAFSETGLLSVDVSALTSLVSIGEEAFYNNELTEIDLSGLSNLTTIGFSAFFGNDLAFLGLTSLSSLTTIGADAFSNNQLTSVTLEGLTNLIKIGDEAFSYNTLDTVHLSGLTKLTTIGRSAFEHNRITAINFTGLSNLTTVGNSAFKTNEITAINFTGLTKLRTIGSGAFGENNLTSVDLSGLSSLSTIGAGAFSQSPGLSEFVLPREGGLWFGDYEGNYSLEEAGTTTTELSSTLYTFHPIYTLTDEDVVVVDGEITEYTSDETNIIIPNMLDGQVITAIGLNTFNVVGLVAVDLSALTELVTIDELAFNSNYLLSIDLSGLTNLSVIGDRAFADNYLTTINFTGLTNLSVIGEEAFTFSECTSLDFTGLTSLRTIGAYAFFNVRFLTSVDLSPLTSLTTLGEYAFSREDNGLPSFALPTLDPTLSGVWEDTDGGTHTSGDEVSVRLGYYYTNSTPYTLTDDDVQVAHGAIVSYEPKLNYANIIIPNTLDGQPVTAIGEHVFYAKNLSSVDFTGMTHLIRIGDEAFIDNKLTSIDFSGLTNLSMIGVDAFANNDAGLTQFTLPTPAVTLVGEWISSNGFSPNPQNPVSVQNGYYYTSSAPYTLTHDDVVIEDGRMVSYQPKLHHPNITIPNVLDDQTITAIGDRVFYARNLSTVDFTGMTNLTAIGYEAFLENNLTDLYLSGLNNLTTIGPYAFRYNSLTTLDLSGLPNLVIIEEYAFSRNNIESINFSGLQNLRTIERYAFSNNDLESVDFSGLHHLTFIGSGAFGQNTNLRTFVLPTPTVAGYIFDGWKSSGSNVYESGEEVFSHNKYQAVVIALVDYELTYNTEGGTYDNPATYTVEDAFTLTPATKDGYDFEGWFTDAEFTTEINRIEEGTTGNLSLFARFTAIDYTITYNADGGLHDNPATYTIDDAITLSAATKEGFTFEGWFTDAVFTTPITAIATGTTGDLEVFARFTENALGLNTNSRITITPYPNPVTSSFSLAGGADYVQVLNQTGQVVREFDKKQTEYDVSDLASGVYILHLTRDGESLQPQQIIINASAQ